MNGEEFRDERAAEDRGRVPGSEASGTAVVDCRGRACPVPVIELAKAIATVEVGSEVMLIADDPAARVDIPVWCRMKHHELVDVDEQAPAPGFRVRRRH